MSLLQLQDTVEAAQAKSRKGETVRLRMALTEALCQVSRSAAFDLGNQAARAARRYGARAQDWDLSLQPNDVVDQLANLVLVQADVLQDQGIVHPDVKFRTVGELVAVGWFQWISGLEFTPQYWGSGDGFYTASYSTGKDLWTSTVRNIRDNQVEWMCSLHVSSKHNPQLWGDGVPPATIYELDALGRIFTSTVGSPWDGAHLNNAWRTALRSMDAATIYNLE